nr:HYR domain-containing protein [uncultured Draconibacterium sp.]
METNSAECVNAISLPETIFPNLVVSEGMSSSNFPENSVSLLPLLYPHDIIRETDKNACTAYIQTGLNIDDSKHTLKSLSWEMAGACRDRSAKSGINQIGAYLFNKGSTVITYSGISVNNDPITYKFTVTVVDNQVPRLVSSPGHITVRNLPEECYANVSWTEPSATDNCVARDQLIFTSNYNSGQQFPVGSTLVEYQISDGVNTAVHNFTVTVMDTEAPELIAPPVLESECGKPIPDAFTTWVQFEQAGGSASDNCSVNYGSFRYVGQTSSGITCPYTVTRTYSISDSDGNVSEVKHVIEVTGEGMAYEAKAESTEPEVLLEPGAETQAEILFSKTDVSCKGSRTGAVDLTVNGASGTLSYVWSTQNGSGIVQGAEDQSSLSDGDYTVMVYEDGVRLLAFDFSILVSDNQVPVLNAPEDIQRTCGQSIPAAYSTWSEFANAGGTVSDNCQIYYSTFRLASETQSNPSCPYTITRTYEIMDVNGNRGFAEHLITVEEAEVVLKSGMGTAAVITSTATGGDWDLGSSWVGGVVPLPTDDVEIVSGATITLTDDRTVVNITNNGTLLIGDNNLQVDGDLVNDGTLTVGSGTITSYGNWTNNGSFNAGTGTVEFTGSTNAIISGTSATTFNNFILDKGTDVTTDLAVQSDITITDLTFDSGVLDIENGTTDIADIANPNNRIPSSSGLRVSGGTLTTGYYSIINEGLIEVTSGAVTFGTGSGNSVHTQVDGAFIVSGGTVDIAGRLENTAGGVLSGYPSGINISGGIITLATAGNNESGTGSLDVTTNGAFNFTGGTVIFENPSTAGTALDLGLVDGPGNEAKTITNGIFQFGNNNTPIGSIFHIDSEIKIPNIVTYSGSALFLAMPADGASSVECIDQATAPTPPVILDNCGYEITPTVPSGYVVTTYDGCEGDVTYTYTYEDCDGSTHDWVFTYNIEDNTAPVFDAITPFTSLCSSSTLDTDIQSWLNGVTATDNCGNVSITNDYDVANLPATGCGDITITFTATDECTNSIQVTQTITINDDTKPTASNLPLVTVQCTTDIPAPDPEIITDEADNCTANPLVKFVSDVSDGKTCPELIRRTYRVADDCGNEIFVMQTFAVDDKIAPVINGAIDETFEEGCSIIDVSAPVTTVAGLETLGLSISDNCTDKASLTVSSNDVASGTCPLIITRTYTIADACGNETTYDQIINMVENTPPVLSGTPSVDKIDVLCDVPPDPPELYTEVTATDNCDTDVEITFEETSTQKFDNSYESVIYAITRTWTATDDCGNSTSETQTINMLCEYCFNFIDDDEDGFTDENDPKCPCSTPSYKLDCNANQFYYIPPVWQMNTEYSGKIYTDPSSLVISTPYGTANVTVRTADSSFINNYTVTQGAAQIVPLTENIVQTPNNNTIESDRGLIVESDQLIQVVYRLTATNNKLLVTIKGEQALGQWFRAGSQTNVCGDPDTVKRENHFISVMAVEDNTIITFDFTTDMKGLGNTHSITLNAGETYLMIDDDNNETVSGSLIVADKPIAVMSGSQHSRQCNGVGRDGGVDQLVPTCVVGSNYVVSRGADDDNTSESNYAVVVGITSNTDITIDGVDLDTTIGPGQYYTYNMPGPDNSNHYIQTSNPAYVYQFGSLQDNGEIGMAVAGPIDGCRRGDRYIDFYKFPDVNVNNTTFIIPNTGLSSFTLNGNSYKTYAEAQSIPGLSDWSTVTFGEDDLALSNVAESDEYFIAYQFVGDGNGGTMGYLTSFKDKLDVFHPETGEKTYEYFAGNVCGGQPVVHTIDASSCSAEKYISTLVGSEHTEGYKIYPNSLTFEYTPEDGFTGEDNITVILADGSGLAQPVCISFYVCGEPPTIIDCPQDIETTVNAGDCLTSGIDIGTPTATGGCSATDVLVITNDAPSQFPIGTTIVTWTVSDSCNNQSTCQQTIIVKDLEPPTFSAHPFEDCVDPLHWAAFNASTNSVDYTPNFPSADYYLLQSGDTDLDIDMSTYSDNCCKTTDSYFIRWEIDFDQDGNLPGLPNISGSGQPSEYGSIHLWGDGVNFQSRIHDITYWITDCNGNESAPVKTTITITPRPEILKQ